jgi:hypothetical protein
MQFLQRLVVGLLALAFFAAAFLFASLIFAAIAVVGVLAWAWIWWRTRNLPRHRAGGTVIEGEYTVDEPELRRLDERR